MRPELLLDARVQLGEGPAWDSAQGLLYWLDIHAGGLHIFHPQDGRENCLRLGEPVGCVAPCQSGDVILALRSGFATIDPGKMSGIKPLIDPEKHIPGNRFNDGKCDPAGRFLAGTMDDAEQAASGSLYSLSSDGMLKTLLTGLRISNGLAWSPDFKTFYFIDTPIRQVAAFDYDLATGGISRPRSAFHVPSELGWPDGMTSDSEGMLWVAMWGGASLTRWDPLTGTLLETISFPALNITSCCFGGPDLMDLYITSARKGMSAVQLEQYPLSGGLFRLRPGVRGMPTFSFGDS